MRGERHPAGVDQVHPYATRPGCMHSAKLGIRDASVHGHDRPIAGRVARGAIEDRSGSEMLDEDSDDVVDVVLLWYREDDGDLVDTLMDALHPLADNGVIWLLTPKSGREGHVPPSDISEAAPTAGLSQTSSISAAKEWSGARLVTPKARGGSKR